MRKRIAAALIISAAAQVTSAAVISEPFNYSTGNLGTVSSGTWTDTTSGTGNVTVVTGNLQYTDANAGYDSLIGTPSGNMALIPKTGKSDRIATTGLPTGSGTLYYSMLLNVNSITGLASTGAFIAGFNNSAGDATSSVTQAGARLEIRTDPNNSSEYDLGIRNDVGSNGTSAIFWDATPHAVGDTVFLVADYEFNSASNSDDVARIWINPDPSTLGAATPPAENGSSTGGDISQLQIQSFFLRPSGSNSPTNVDEIQMGTSWASVTSVPEPASLSLLALGAIGLLKRRRNH